MKNKIIILTIIILTFVIILIPLKGSYAFYSDNKDLKVINTRVGDWKSTLGYLRMNDKNNNLSKDTLGDMYRYQGTDNVLNWICFGTTENCGTNDELIDKYMYRIIGITEEGQLYLLKETFIKGGNVTEFKWNTKYLVSDCLGDACEWPNVDLYKRLNGISNGIGDNTDIFVDSEYYDYLKSGDSYNGTKDEVGSSWYQLIENHSWMYGDTNKSTADSSIYNGNVMYAIETGKNPTKRNWPDEGTQTTCTEEVKCTEKDYTWSKSITAKIGLMYMHDVDFAYIGGIPNNRDNVKNSWIHSQKDGYNSSTTAEWLITRLSATNTSYAGVSARHIHYNGTLGLDGLNYMRNARPVFYLTPDIKIKNGTTGTKTNPFIIEHELINNT